MSEELLQLIEDLVPDMESRIEGLRNLWPGRDIITHLHRNEALLRRMKAVLIKSPPPLAKQEGVE